MREIKFRGQTGTTEGKKWVYGHYYRVKSFFDDIEGHYINTIRSDHLKDYNVYKETVGQYTGLHDKNEKEIYEKMIINNEYIVVYDFCKFALKNIYTGNVIDFEKDGVYEITGEYFK